VGCDRLSLTRADVEWLDQPKCGVQTHLGSDHKESSKGCVDKSHVCKSSLASTCNTSTFSTSWQILFLYFTGHPACTSELKEVLTALLTHHIAEHCWVVITGDVYVWIKLAFEHLST
jgi:hypothetical protein